MISIEATNILRWLKEQNAAGENAEQPFHLTVHPHFGANTAILEHLGLGTRCEVARKVVRELLSFGMVRYEKPRRYEGSEELNGDFKLTASGASHPS